MDEWNTDIHRRGKEKMQCIWTAPHNRPSISVPRPIKGADAVEEQKNSVMDGICILHYKRDASLPARCEGRAVVRKDERDGIVDGHGG